VHYFTECISSETQKETKINILNNKQKQLNNTADKINKIIYIKTNVSYAKPLLNIWLLVIGYTKTMEARYIANKVFPDEIHFRRCTTVFCW